MRKVGIVVGSDRVIVVDVDMTASDSMTIIADHSWPLQTGSRCQAYAVMHQQVVNYLTEQSIEKVVIKASAVNRGGTKKAHLQAAELRGVVLAAAASVTETQEMAKASVSRGYGTRKADEYLKDDGFWDNVIVGGELRIGSREAALVLLATEG